MYVYKYRNIYVYNYIISSICKYLFINICIYMNLRYMYTQIYICMGIFYSFLKFINKNNLEWDIYFKWGSLGKSYDLNKLTQVAYGQKWYPGCWLPVLFSIFLSHPSSEYLHFPPS